jgi:small-conductance mechanosensitive channel
MTENGLTLMEEWKAYFKALLTPENILGIGTVALKILVILFISYLATKVLTRVIDATFSLRKTDESKNLTLTKLLKSIVRYVIFFIAGLTILKNVGLDPTPVIAGAGVLGLAIGFGAQNLVRDIINGFFIIFEDQFSVGDYVMINNSSTGTIEEMGLRITRVREWNGRLHNISNGEIKQITNYNREKMRPLVSVRVPYEENMEEVFNKLDQVCKDVGEAHKDGLIEQPTVFGITDIDNGGVQFTVMALSVPAQYWFIERQLRKRIIEVFQSDKIEFAYPRRVLVDGNTPMFS